MHCGPEPPVSLLKLCLFSFVPVIAKHPMYNSYVSLALCMEVSVPHLRVDERRTPYRHQTAFVLGRQQTSRAIGCCLTGENVITYS